MSKKRIDLLRAKAKLIPVCENYTKFCCEVCDKCYDEEVHQRKSNDFPSNYDIESYARDGDVAEIIWSDGHKSQYNINWILDQIRDNFFEDRPQLWTAEEIRDLLPSINCVYNKLTDKDTDTLITALLQLGIAFVHNVDPTMEGTEKIVNHIGPVMRTIYGGMWAIDADGYDQYRDFAYTPAYLSCHTDNTYFVAPAGLQVFHCTKPADVGGETLLLDGFKAAELLKKRNYKFYECLKSTPMEWQFISNDYHMKHTSRIFKTTDSSDELEQIRFNIYDRTPRVPFTKDVNLVYESMNSFQKILQETGLQLKIKLQPGTVAFVNNWRVLHGRTGFRGQRKLHGCYVAMDVLLSKARKLGILR